MAADSGNQRKLPLLVESTVLHIDDESTGEQDILPHRKLSDPDVHQSRDTVKCFGTISGLKKAEAKGGRRA